MNFGQHGFYRVNYLPDHWKALSTALITNHSALTPSDRWGLIDDIFSLAAAESAPYGTAMDLIQYIKADRHPVPWSSASSNLGSIQALVYNTNLYPGFRVWLITVFEINFIKYFCLLHDLEIYRYSGGASFSRIAMEQDRFFLRHVRSFFSIYLFDLTFKS